ncbi:hypothetical protein [Luteimonas sp. TWI1437]|uniref:hypothetical protein n=1 Tax=unclassified Luteimonas TaxID=2629088 RepID=UPI003208C899
MRVIPSSATRTQTGVLGRRRLNEKLVQKWPKDGDHKQQAAYQLLDSTATAPQEPDNKDQAYKPRKNSKRAHHAIHKYSNHDARWL